MALTKITGEGVGAIDSLDVTGTGGQFTVDANGHITSKQSLDAITAGGRIIGATNRGTVAQIDLGQTAASADGGYIRFLTCDSGSTNPTERMRLLSGGGLTFNGDTAAANALNDFETGTFTAVLDNVSVGYGSRSGRYTKIGNTVFVHLEITTTSLDTTDGSAYQIGGLPFTADGGGVLFSYDSENSTSLTQKSTRLGARMNNGLSSVRLSRDGSDYAYNNGTQSAGSIVCTLQYFTSQ